MSLTDKYDAIVKKYSEPLYWHIRRMVVCHEDAEDILQDTLLSMFTHFWQLRDTSKTRPWLYKIATNNANRFLRDRAKALNCEDISDHLCDIIEGNKYVNYEKGAAIDLQKAILKLPKTQQLVFNLRFYDDMDYQQISEIVGSSVDSARVNYHLAKKTVSKYIKDEQI